MLEKKYIKFITALNKPRHFTTSSVLVSVSIALFLTTASAYSNTESKAPQSSSSGVHIGLSTGASHTNVKYEVNQDNIYPASNPYGILNIKSDAGKTQEIAQGFIGWGTSIQHFYLGVDAYAGYDASKVTPFDNIQSGRIHGFWKASVKHGFHYGLSPRIGYRVSPDSMMYLGLNIEAGKWQAKVTPDPDIAQDVGENYYGGPYGSRITQAQVNQSLVMQNSTRKTVTFAPRIGFDLFVTKNIFVRAEYSYLFGPKIKINLYTAGNYSVASDSVTQTFKINQQRFSISVGYKFNL